MAAADTRTRVHTFLVVREPGRADHIVVWDTQDLTVGRAPENDLSIDMAELSRKHAVFKREGDVYAVCNMSNSNETLLGGRPVQQQSLKSGDIVRLADLELLFYQGPKNPLSAGLKLEYASQLKQFSGLPSAPANGDVTMLGLMDPLPGDAGEDLEVEPPGAFEYDLQGLEGRPRDVLGSDPAPRDLDLEIGPEGESRSVSLHLELHGLTPDLRALVVQLLGKDIELPKLRIKVKSDDLG